jgi:hypothetical protein
MWAPARRSHGKVVLQGLQRPAVRHAWQKASNVLAEYFKHPDRERLCVLHGHSQAKESFNAHLLTACRHVGYVDRN